jgi:tRNA-guanine family transglycosylase
MLGPILVSIHNLTFYSRLMGLLREAIIENRFDEVKQNLERSLSGGEPLSSAENDA